MLPVSIATLCGLWGLSGSLAWSFARTRSGMLGIILATQPGYVAHWFLSGDLTAAALSAFSMLLTLLSLGLSGPEGSWRVRLTRWAFVAALLPIAGIVAATFDGPGSALAGLGIALGCCARWQTDRSRFRALMTWCCVPWLAHDVLAMSGPALAADVWGLARGTWMGWRERVRAARSRLASAAVGREAAA